MKHRPLHRAAAVSLVQLRHMPGGRSPGRHHGRRPRGHRPRGRRLGHRGRCLSDRRPGHRPSGPLHVLPVGWPRTAHCLAPPGQRFPRPRVAQAPAHLPGEQHQLPPALVARASSRPPAFPGEQHQLPPALVARASSRPPASDDRQARPAPAPAARSRPSRSAAPAGWLPPPSPCRRPDRRPLPPPAAPLHVPAHCVQHTYPPEQEYALGQDASEPPGRRLLLSVVAWPSCRAPARSGAPAQLACRHHPPGFS
mmetsp:Transcript_28319/g.42091  ORF Transcript_28319/g.42091 Transcript_28319/m.42091 type:complete len:253 (+) Transcript_28319:832-1590(+)